MMLMNNKIMMMMLKHDRFKEIVINNNNDNRRRGRRFRTMTRIVGAAAAAAAPNRDCCYCRCHSRGDDYDAEEDGFNNKNGYSSSSRRRRRRRKLRTNGNNKRTVLRTTVITRAHENNDIDNIFNAIENSRELLTNAIMDERSQAIAIASPLFALSVVPYLLFLKQLFKVKTATEEQKYAFATLLVFVLISIPAEVYTKDRYHTQLSNIDSLHFLIQSAISLTNLRILLAFRGERRKEGGEELNNSHIIMSSSDNSTIISTTTTTTTDYKESSNNSSSDFRPGAAVEAVAGLILLCTGVLMALDDRLISTIDFVNDSNNNNNIFNNGLVHVTEVIQSARAYAEEFDEKFISLLGNDITKPPENALSVPTWGVHIFSLVEWLVAMGFVWDYGTKTKHIGWKYLTIAMLPLHASGICAVTQHFFNNDISLEWLIALQGLFTMIGNFGLFLAARVLMNEEADFIITSSSTAAGGGQKAYDDEEENQIDNKSVNNDNNNNDVEIWDVERLGVLLEKDDDFTFTFKIAIVSIAIAAAVRGASLVFAPEFAINNNEYDPHHQSHFDELNAYAFLFVFVPLLINSIKWRLRFDREDELSTSLKLQSPVAVVDDRKKKKKTTITSAKQTDNSAQSSE